MNKEMTYEEYTREVKNCILTDAGNCPVTSLLAMLQGKWKFQLIYELCIQDPIRFGELRKNIKGKGENLQYAQEGKTYSRSPSKSSSVLGAMLSSPEQGAARLCEVAGLNALRTFPVPKKKKVALPPPPPLSFF